MKDLTGLFPQRRLSAKALRRTPEQRRARIGYETKKRQAEVAAGIYARHQKLRRYTGVEAVHGHRQWDRRDLAALVLPLTAREISVLLRRTIPSVEQKIESLKTLLLVLEKKVRVQDLPPRRRQRVQRYMNPGPHGVFPAENINWLIRHYGLRSETFRQHDEFGNIIPTITRPKRHEAKADR